MKSRLQKVYAIVTDQIDQAIHASDAPRPDVRANLFEVLGLANSREWVSHHSLDQVKDSESRLSICINPPVQIFEALGFDNGRPGFAGLAALA